ncbi:uncharacterized protein [Bemisia tabaci]|uniref:uncharacterized protein isoform X2 n=1 Tax=Bemisia tabaci TaxID=7038 RepID=UPI003B2871C4
MVQICLLGLVERASAEFQPERIAKYFDRPELTIFYERVGAQVKARQNFQLQLGIQLRAFKGHLRGFEDLRWDRDYNQFRMEISTPCGLKQRIILVETRAGVSPLNEELHQQFFNSTAGDWDDWVNKFNEMEAEIRIFKEAHRAAYKNQLGLLGQ